MRTGKIKRLLAMVFSVTLLLTYSGVPALAETVGPQEEVTQSDYAEEEISSRDEGPATSAETAENKEGALAEEENGASAETAENEERVSAENEDGASAETAENEDGALAEEEDGASAETAENEDGAFDEEEEVSAGEDTGDNGYAKRISTDEKAAESFEEDDKPQENAKALSAGRDVLVSTWDELKDAIDDGAFITLLQDIYGPGEGGSDPLTVPEGKEVRLDLNGHTLGQGPNTDFFMVYGTLIIGRGTVECSNSTNGFVVQSGGTLIQEGGVIANASQNGVTLNGGSTFKMMSDAAINNCAMCGVIAGENSEFHMENSTISENGKNADDGSVYPGVDVQGGCFYMEEGSTITGNGDEGVRIEGGTFKMYHESAISENGDEGIFIDGGRAEIYDNSSITNNTYGIHMIGEGASVVMYGGAINGNDRVNDYMHQYYDGADNEFGNAGVWLEGGEFILQNGTISNNNEGNHTSAGVWLDGGSAKILGGTIENDQYGVLIHNDSTVEMTGGSIADNKYGVNIRGLGSAFTLSENGTISGNSSCGVKAEHNGNFFMSGGEVSYNGNDNNGIGIWLDTDCFLELSGGIITGNETGVYVAGSTVNMSGGSIKLNEDNGVQIAANSIFDLSGDGMIAENKEYGVDFANGGCTFNLNGGTIEGNGKGGVSTYETKLYVCGKPVVKNNGSEESPCNIYLSEDSGDYGNMYVSGPFEEGADLSVTSEKGTDNVTVTLGYNERNTNIPPNNFIHADAKGCDIILVNEEAVIAETDEVIIKGVTGSFNDRIKLNYYLRIPASLRADPSAKVVITSEENPDRTVTLPVSGAEYDDEKGGYKFSVELAAKEASDTITAKVYDGNDNEVTLIGGSSGKDYTGTGVQYSLMQYFDWLKENGTDDREKAVGAAAKDYCAAVQIYFNYNAENVSVSSAVDDVAAESLNEYIAGRESTLPTGVNIRGISAMLESDNTLRLYLGFKDVEPSTFTFKIDGTETVLRQRSDGMYYLALDGGVFSNRLHDPHTYSVSDGTDNYTISASVLTYARSCAIKKNENESRLGKALYLYNRAAVEAFGE